MRRPSAAALVLWSILASVPVAGAQTLPKPAGRVGDGAGVLTPAARTELETLLAALEKDTGAEVVVATTRSLDGLAVEAYAHQVFADWQIGQQRGDRGVLVLVAPTERRMRIEVGQGLRRVIPDGLAGAIIREDFLPVFRDGQYEAGIVAGTRHVADIVRANRVQSPAPLAAPPASSRMGAIDWVTFGIFGLMWLVGVGLAGTMFGQAMHLRSGSNLLFGVMGVGIFAGLPMAFLPRTGLILLPLLVAGGAWGYRRQPLAAARSRGGSSDSSDSGGSWDSDSGSSSSGSSDSGGSSGGASGSW